MGRKALSHKDFTVLSGLTRMFHADRNSREFRAFDAFDPVEIERFSAIVRCWIGAMRLLWSIWNGECRAGVGIDPGSLIFTA